MSIAYWVAAFLVVLGGLLRIANGTKPYQVDGTTLAIATLLNAGIAYLLIRAAVNS